MQPKVFFPLCLALLLALTLAWTTSPWSTAIAEDVPGGLQLVLADDDQGAEEEGDEEDVDEEGFEEEDFGEEGEHEIERHHRHLEIEMVEMERNFGRLEMVGKIAEIANEELLAAAFAIMHVTEFMEPEAAIDFLTNALGEARNPGIHRMIRIKLAEIYAHTDQPEMAQEQLRALIISR